VDFIIEVVSVYDYGRLALVSPVDHGIIVGDFLSDLF
jgi:hypothetical protein